MPALENKIHLAVISANRPMAVGNINRLIGKDFPATWYVGRGDARMYGLAGAKTVVESGGLINSRNAALNQAFHEKKICVQLSDDLLGVSLATSKTSFEPLGVLSAIGMILKIMDDVGALMGGAAPTANPFYFDPDKPVRTNLFIVADLLVVKPNPLRFDPKLRLKEDYDYTLQHLKKYGKVARCDAVLANFKHRTNYGGAVAYRTPKYEQEAIGYLKNKWGGAIVDNPRRPNEILMRWGKAK